MRRGYSQDIRAEAITKRYQGRPWIEIQATIEEKFGARPSVRQMQKWFDDYRSTTDDPTGVKYVAKVIEDAANLAQPLAQAKMMSEVMPIWGQLQREPDLSSVDAGWMAFLSFFESQIGRDNFDRIVQRYLKDRDRLIRQSGRRSSSA